MKKRIQSLAAAILFLVTTVLSVFTPVMNASADTKEITVRLHYQRQDGKYDGWNIWSWTTGAGKQYEFTKEDDFGKVSEYKLSAEDDTVKVGFIIRKSENGNEWSAKDTDGDRFIDLTKVKDNAIDVYVLSGQAEFDYDKKGVFEPKVKSVSAVSEKTLSFQMTKEVKEDLTKKGTLKDTLVHETYPIEKIELNGKTGTITLKKKYDVSSEYLEFDLKGYNSVKVNPISIFSTPEFEKQYTYDGNDLGAIWSKDKTTFKVWAPTAKHVAVNLYKSGDSHADDMIDTIDMEQNDNGIWSAEKNGDLNKTYYTYSVKVNGSTIKTIDPYAKACGVNGMRGMILNLNSTNPKKWTEDKRVKCDNITDAIVYETHIRDLSADKSSGIKNVGKFLEFTEKGTKNKNGDSTGLDHLIDLGITHVQLMPSFDYASVDEEETDEAQYNWGYDPDNYNIPEGSYSTNAKKGEVRVKEYKQMVQSLHENNIGVIMDVVYNHTASTDFSFNRIVPGYYYRANADGSLSNGSGCGNDAATERSMVRKYIVDSVAYWAKEYHIDGFRFDLVGLMDVDTMKEIRAALDEIDPNIIMYGEGWTMSTNVSKLDTKLATQPNSKLLPGMAMFSDNIRDALKGSVFDSKEKGYVNGSDKKTDDLIDGVKGTQKWAANPTNAVTYTSCHDNLTLWDKINASNKSDSKKDRVKQDLLAASIIFTSQGMSFMSEGDEILRSKTKKDGTVSDNSYNLPDSVNSLKWNDLDKNGDVYDYYKGLIEFRKAHAALRMTKKTDVDQYMKMQNGLDKNVVAYTIDGKANNDIADELFVVYNPNKKSTKVTLPKGEWKLCVDSETAGTSVIKKVSKSITVDSISCAVLVKGETGSTGSNSITAYIIGGVAGIVVIAGAAVLFLVLRKKKAAK